jgi:hypothetical protein
MENSKTNISESSRTDQVVGDDDTIKSSADMMESIKKIQSIDDDDDLTKTSNTHVVVYNNNDDDSCVKISNERLKESNKTDLTDDVVDNDFIGTSNTSIGFDEKTKINRSIKVNHADDIVIGGDLDDDDDFTTASKTKIMKSNTANHTDDMDIDSANHNNDCTNTFKTLSIITSACKAGVYTGSKAKEISNNLINQPSNDDKIIKETQVSKIGETNSTSLENLESVSFPKENLQKYPMNKYKDILGSSVTLRQGEYSLSASHEHDGSLNDKECDTSGGEMDQEYLIDCTDSELMDGGQSSSSVSDLEPSQVFIEDGTNLIKELIKEVSSIK